MTNFNSPSRRWVTRVGWLTLSIAFLVLAGLLVANVVDYRRYYRAAHFEEFEGMEKVRELARTCFDLGKAGYGTPSEYPPNIARLKPRWVSIGRDDAQIGLYGHDDDASVFLLFEKYGGNEVVSVCDYVRGETEARTIFVQDQAAYDFLHPKERIVTLAQATMSRYVEWIVLVDEVRVVASPGAGGSQVLGRRPISEAERRAVETEVRAIPAAVRGRHFEAGVMDGIKLDIFFGPDGRRGRADIELDNTWREEAGPLVNLVEQLSPKDQELQFRSLIEGDLKERPRKQSAVTWADEAKFEERSRRPWWRVWPRLKMPD